MEPIRQLPQRAKIVTAPGFPEHEFAPVREAPGVWNVWHVATGLEVPCGIANSQKEALADIAANFHLTPEQVEYHNTKGIFSPKAIALSMQKAQEVGSKTFQK